MAKGNEPRRALALGQTAITVLSQEVAASAQPLARGIAITVNGLVVEGEPSFEAMGRAVRTMCVTEKGSGFGLGDAQLKSEELFGERASQLFDADTGLSEKTLGVYRWLAERIAPDRRRMDRLGIHHHILVAVLSPAKQAKWLTLAAADAEERPWSVAYLKGQLVEREEDAPAQYLVVVEVPNGVQQNELLERMEAEGLKAKATVRRGRRPQTAALPATALGTVADGE